MSNCLCLKCKAFKNCELLKELKHKNKQIEELDKDFNLTMHEFNKLMQYFKIHSGVQTKLLVPFMRFHLKLKKEVQE